MNKDGNEGKRAVSHSVLTEHESQVILLSSGDLWCLENDLKEKWDVKVACMRGGGFTEFHDMHGNGNDNFLLAVISISGENTICLYPQQVEQ